MASESGFSNQKKLGTAQFKTIHSVGNDKFGQSVASKALYEKTAEEEITVTDVIGNSGQVEFLNVYFPAHNASVSDVLRITTGLQLNFEFDVLSVIDVDNFLVLPLFSAVDISGDSGIIMGWVTNKANSDGSQIVTLAPVPIQFIQDLNVVNVSQDSNDPENSVPLPILNFIIKDGFKLPITSDSTDPANNVPLPANNFFKLDGVDVPVSKDTTNPINTIALPTEDLIAQASLTSIDGKFTTLNAKDFATSAKQDTGNTSLTSIDGKFTTLNAKDFATSAKQDTGNSSLSSIDGKLQENGALSASNSSTTPLGISGIFTGAAVEITKYACLNINVISDVPSATNGVKVEFSTDGVTWDHSHSTSYTATSGVGYIFNAEFRYARVVYTNGATAQAYFRLQTILKSVLVTSSLYTLSQSLSSNMFAQLNRSIITGETTGGGGGYVNVKVTPAGALTVEADVTGFSATTLPLPTGASTLAEQQTQSTYLSSIDNNSGTAILPVHTEASAFTSASYVVSGIDPIASTVRALRVNSSDQLLTFIGNSSVVIQQSSQAGIITSTQKSVGLTAVRATVAGSAPLSSRKKVMFKPSKNNTGSIYLGSSSVTIANGMEIIGPDRLEFTFDSSDYYLISDTAGQVVEIVEVV